jgi:OHCU decarboxylase
VLPTIEQLNSMEEGECARAIGVLFEGSPRFASSLAAFRPFDSYGHLVRVGERLARSLPEEDQLELIDGHPRIGAAPSMLSAQSHAEQGYDQAPLQAEVDLRLAQRLAELNDAYERRFGFRFVVFVAGRPRSEIAGLMEHRLEETREAEMDRALIDVFAIARDRLAKVTQIPEEVG